jgi:hypothetical protein
LRGNEKGPLVKMGHHDQSGSFLALTNKKVSKNIQRRGHSRADARLRRAHDDVAGGEKEGCGLDEFISFLLQQR